MIYSVIARQGGKSRLVKYIKELFPRDHKFYAEVFGGAAWILLNKKPSLIEVFNDVDGNVVNLFRIIRDFPGEFINRFRYDIVARETFDEYKNIDLHLLDSFDRAVKFYYVYCNSFSADMSTFMKRDKITNPNRFNSRLPEIVEKFTARMENVVIENLDFREFFNKYNGKEWLFYLDPPYYGVEGYEEPFNEQEHKDLAYILSNNFEGKFILSYNDIPEIRNLYSQFQIEVLDIIYQAANRPKVSKDLSGKKTELVITNFNANFEPVREKYLNF
jgi:DNA adenine methylase